MFHLAVASSLLHGLLTRRRITSIPVSPSSSATNSKYPSRDSSLRPCARSSNGPSSRSETTPRGSSDQSSLDEGVKEAMTGYVATLELSTRDYPLSPRNLERFLATDSAELPAAFEKKARFVHRTRSAGFWFIPEEDIAPRGGRRRCSVSGESDKQLSSESCRESIPSATQSLTPWLCCAFPVLRS